MENFPLLISTRNPHKIDEVRAILGPDFEVSDLSVIQGMQEVEETGDTFEENATLKAVAASLHYDGWVVADDSGLEVEALGGAPGVLSARFAGPGSSDAGNNDLLLSRMSTVRGKARAARFRCVLVLARAGRKLAAFEGIVNGLLAPSPKGEGGFGYDPLFIPEGWCQTFAQIPQDSKNALSHRARALEKLRAWGGWS